MNRFSFPTDIQFGNGVRARVGARLQAESVRRPLVVTDKGLATLPAVLDLQNALRNEGLATEVFAGVWGNPVKSQVLAGVAAFRAHAADGIVGIGGGAALDVAKAIALMVNHPGDLFDYEDDLPGARPFDQPIPFWVAVPTTAGTGSEVGRSAVISDDETHVKKIIFSPRLLAKAVFADPELTVGLPAHITAATGLDALTHNIEAFLAKAFHPICDGIALEGLRLGAMHLKQAVKVPTDLEARAGMMMSSMMGAIAFQKGLGLVHSCAHALGTVCNMHHGLANGVMIDHALVHNVGVATDKFVRMAQTVGIKNPGPEAFIGWLETLKADVGIPATLTAAGVAPAALQTLVDVAVADACHPNNPRPCTREDFQHILEAAF
ncbi:MAG: iron-containing alcohol dehydrogenase [Deltaproteobacteria bacterium]|nr:iron-containing alcohol dehydrogenase [Deltaproteobacteria bacterium]